MHEEEGVLELDWRPLRNSVDEELLKGVSRGCIARKFHESLVNLVFDAVSYTHLDVYKRQGGWRPSAALPHPSLPAGIQ